MSRETWETLRVVSPCPNNLWLRAAASTATRTFPSPGRDTAVGACATAPPNGSDSSPVSLRTFNWSHLYFVRLLLALLSLLHLLVNCHSDRSDPTFSCARPLRAGSRSAGISPRSRRLQIG